MNNFDLKNKIAIITGGAQGFGLDIAKKFLKFGAQVRIWDNDETELSNAIKKEENENLKYDVVDVCLLYTSPSPRDQRGSREAGCG